MYNEFAQVYDALTDDFDYEAWASRYLALVSPNGNPPRTLHECGCGTGSISVRMAQSIKKVTASDISESMLSLAQEKARRFGVSVQFILQDMRKTQLPRPVDAIICPCDGVNYLLTDDDLTAFFSSAAAFCKPGGILAFDYSTPKKLLQMAQRELYFEDRSSITYFWQNRMESDSVLNMNLVFFVRQNGGSYQRLDEAQRQKLHDAQHLQDLLRQCGFQDISCYDALSPNPAQEDSVRILIRAVKS